MDYLTVKEVAELKSCSERYIKKICKDGKIETKQELNCKGRMKYMIPVSALSEQEQIKYYSNLKKEAGLAPVLKEEKTTLKQRKKIVKKALKPFEEYSEDERKQINFWCSLLTEWQNQRSAYQKKTEFDKLYVCKLMLEYPQVDISVSVLYKKYSAFKINDLEGLVDKRGGWNKGMSSIPSEVWQAFLWYYLDENKPTVSACYKDTREWCAEFSPELFDIIPTERSFRRHIQTDIQKATLIYMREGEKAMTDRCLPYIERMYDKLHANDVWIADNHTIDVQSLNDEGKINRLYVTAFQDAKSGTIVGWNVTKSPDSQSTIIALRHAIKRFGIPKMVYFDNGREFLTYDVGGMGHRTKTKRKQSDEILPPTILQRLGIEMRNAIVRNAKAKPIERTFYTLKNQFSKAFNGYCGGTILERPESLKRRIKNGEIPRDYEIRDTLDLWFDGGYNVQAYGGAEIKYKGMSRIDVWNDDIQNVGVRRASESELNLMLMRATRYQKIKRNGVYVNIFGEKIWYMDINETYKHLDEEVCVRYDPADLREVRIYDKSDKYLYTWRNADIMLVDYITDVKEEIKDAEKAQRAVKRFIKNDASGAAAGLSSSQRITAIDMAVRRAHRNKNEKFKIKMPTRIIPVQTGEALQKAVGAEDIIPVEINMRKIIGNAERRKG